MNPDTQPKKSIRKSLNLSIAIRLAVWIGKILPRHRGSKLAAFIGTLIGSNPFSPMVRAIRANQWVIHEGSLTKKELRRKPRVIFSSAAKCIFDYFYFLSRPQELLDIIDFSPNGKLVCERIKSNQACVCVCPHLSNFDLMGYALALLGLEMQVLSYPDPNASYQLQNKIREDLGIIVTPMSLSAFRQAKKRLHEGKSILTGVDRPFNSQQQAKNPPTFFGHEANLPASYVRMAIDANAPVIVVASTPQPGGRYKLEGSAPIWMETGEHIEDEITHNANIVLKATEDLIKKYSDHWAMFYPVWPQFLGK
jgi:lauroyl/myristoyl acyltransferase